MNYTPRLPHAPITTIVLYQSRKENGNECGHVSSTPDMCTLHPVLSQVSNWQFIDCSSVTKLTLRLFLVIIVTSTVKTNEHDLHSETTYTISLSTAFNREFPETNMRCYEVEGFRVREQEIPYIINRTPLNKEIAIFE